jgi:hypothetical protein
MAGEVVSLESREETPREKTPAELHRFWAGEKEAAQKRLRKFVKQGNSVVRRFLDERQDQSNWDSSGRGDVSSRLNLFHTNISTLLAMLYGSTPKIEVAREHHDPDDDVARVASYLYQRILEADVYSSGDDLATTLKASLQDRLLPGLGTARVRYGMETATTVAMEVDEMGMEVEVETEELIDEWCKCEYVHWQDFLWGWGRTWTEIPWLGYRSWLTKDEAKARFGPEVAKNLEYKQQTPAGANKTDDTFDKDQQNNVEKAEIWEFWHKADRKVYWYNEGAELILDAQDDPLELEGFWPSPLPMVANLTTTMFVPRADFVIAQDLYNEIDELQTRIAVITKAIKVVGVYDKNAGDSVGRMLKEGMENDLIPVDNWAMFAEKGALRGQIDWFPVDTIVGVLQTLTQIQEQKMSQLYQITGMNDLMRGGNTDQYTAAGTQQLKAKMGSIRVQALQDQFARFASDLDALKCEVISKHFSPESILLQSNATFIPEADRDKLEPAIQLMKSEDVKWRVTIRPETIAMIDYAQLKQERSEFLTAMATYIQSAQAAVKSVPGSLPVLLEMLKWGMAGFKGSNMLEGTMDQAIEMAKDMPQEDPNAQQNKQAEMQQQMAQAAHQMQLEQIQAKHQADMMQIQTKLQGEVQKQMADHQAKMEQANAKAQGDISKIAADLRADLQVIAAKLDADLQEERSQAVNAAAESQVNHENALVEADVEHTHNLIEMDQELENAALEAELQPRDREE